MTKQKATFSIDTDVYAKFKRYCNENAIMLSKKIENFMKGELTWNQKGVDRRKKK